MAGLRRESRSGRPGKMREGHRALAPEIEDEQSPCSVNRSATIERGPIRSCGASDRQENSEHFFRRALPLAFRVHHHLLNERRTALQQAPQQVNLADPLFP